MTTVATLTANLALESASFESGAARARRSMQETQRSIQADVSRINQTLSTATAATAAFFSGFVRATVATAAIAGVGLAARAAVAEFVEGERAANKLGAVLRATGGIAGQTAESIIEFSEAVERSTTTSAESVQEAAAVLATFENVAGGAFTRTLTLANDLSFVFGTDLTTATRQLGKALEDPAEGVNLLDRSYRIFSDTQEETIKHLAETGRQAEAIEIIFRALEERVGGAAGGAAQGVTGAFTRLGTAVVNLAGDVAGAVAEITKLDDVLNTIAAGVETIGGAIGEVPEGDISAQINARIRERAELEAQRKTLAEGIGGFQTPAAQAEVAIIDARIRKLTEEEDQLIKTADAERKNAAEIVKSTEERKKATTLIAQYEAAPAAGGPPVPVERSDIDERIAAFNLLLQKEEEAGAASRASAAAAESEARAAEAAAQREAEARQAVIDRLVLQSDEAARLHQAYLDGEEATAATNLALKIENELRLAGVDAASDQGRAIAKLVTQREKEITGLKKAKDEWDRFAKIGADFRQEQERRATGGQENIRRFNDEATKAAETAAQAQADALTAPFDEAARSVQRLFADTFANIISGGIANFEDFADQAARIAIDIPSQILSAAIVGPINAAIQSAITQTAAQGGAAGPFGVLGQFARANPALAAFGLGTAGGGLLTQFTGGNAQFGALGGGLGAALGTAFLGPVGGIIGGLGGSLLGGLFGGGENLGNDRASTRFWVGGDTPGKVWEDSNASAENRRAVNAVAEQLVDVTRLLTRQGIDFGGGFGLSIQAGNETGFELDGKRFSSEAELTGAAIARILDLSYEQVSKEDPLRAVLRESQAKTAAELGADIDFAKTFKSLTTEQSEFATALESLQDNFADVRFRAEELGISITKLTAAEKKASQELFDEFERNITDRRDSAAAGIRSFFESLLAPLQQATGAFGISAGIVAPVATAQAGLEEFREQFRLARTGDTTALQGISSLGQQVIEAQRAIGASGTESAAVFREIQSALTSLQADLEQQRVDALKDLIDESQLTVREQTDRMVEELQDIKDELAQLRRDRLLL